eukprot:TRINITY_DN15406_c1_g4_i1.p1 TRINITY_DN15406_c1_g4~~TRINITY_DN15406_c1_g4_i1.p1  ORF type:complete len:627 (-),score=85.71 TRINITY_DN15406_c1_g4_i1:310-2190(-)
MFHVGMNRWCHGVRFLVYATCMRLVCAADKCNGAEEFCELQLQDMTFAGTHNTGSYGLSVPEFYSYGAAGNFIVKCWFENHDNTIMQQLNNGIRYLSVDICDKDTEPGAHLCHAQAGRDDTKSAMGVSLNAFLSDVRQWLLGNPSEVVVLSPSDVHCPIELFSDAVVEVFGSCTNGISGVSAGLQCVWWDKNVLPNLTMGHLVDTGGRFIVFKSESDVLPYSWGGGNSGLNHTKLLNHLKDWTHEKTQSATSKAVWVWDVFGSMQVANADKYMVDMNNLGNVVGQLSDAYSQTQVKCSRAIAKSVNENFFPGDDADSKYQVADTTCDGTCGCLGYKSELEILHQQVLDSGHNIIAITADYTTFGDLPATVRRMNFASVRRKRGQKELGIPWYQCAWGISVICICSCSMLLGMVLIYLRHRSPELFREYWLLCLSCPEFCCDPAKYYNRSEKERRLRMNQAIEEANHGQERWKSLPKVDMESGTPVLYRSAPPGFFVTGVASPHANIVASTTNCMLPGTSMSAYSASGTSPASGIGVAPAPGFGVAPAPGIGVAPAPGFGVAPAPVSGTSMIAQGTSVAIPAGQPSQQTPTPAILGVQAKSAGLSMSQVQAEPPRRSWMPRLAADRE